MIFDKENAKKASQPFFILAAIAFIFTSIVGLLISFKIALPNINHLIFPFEKLRPLHTFFPIVGVLAGAHAWITYMTADQRKKITNSLSNFSFLLLLLFVSGAGSSLVVGKFSGREYFSWPPAFSILLILSVAIMCFLLYKKFSYLSKKSPEGSWLIGFGSVFILIGLSESLIWLIPSIGNNFVKDLSIQWHGIDTFFAGINAFLYGIGVFVLQKDPKPLRKKWLYALAVFSLLFTFGHHHYISPQPHFLKILAFIASMIAMFSFVKHFRAYYNTAKQDKASRSALETLFRSVELWTIVSFGSGILFAIPQFNLIVHGTYLIVVHSMGSMIGVQLMLIFVAGFSIFKPANQKSEDRIKLGVKLLNNTLILLWVLMGIVGIIKGTMRMDHSYFEINNTMQNYLYFLPVLGILLFISISLISIELIRVCMKANRGVNVKMKGFLKV